jgi:hypothetical protein
VCDRYDSQQAVLLAQQAPPGCWSSVWASLNKALSHNYLSWNETGTSAFASQEAFAEGRPIFIGSYYRRALAHYRYALSAYGTFTQQYVEWLTQAEVAVLNNGTTTFYMGLAQDISLNMEEVAMTPLFVCEVMGKEHEVYTVTPQSFYVFLGPRTAPGTMTKDLRRVARSQLTLVSFNNGAEKVSLSYDRDLGRFLVDPAAPTR